MSDAGLAPDWPQGGLDDDVRPALASLAAAGTPFALATIHAADGGPRPVGSQVVVADGRAGEGVWGFLSGGCVDADVARQGREVLASWAPRRVTYGHGSPFFDIRLPCGGRIDLLVEPVAPDDAAMGALVAAARMRQAVRYQSDGTVRRVVGPTTASGAWLVDRLHEPAQRLVVVGGDPFALAIAAAGRHQGWEVTLVRPNGPAAPPPLDVAYRTEAAEAALAALAPDPWTAVAVATHDADVDERACLAALGSAAGYVGLLGARRRLDGRRARLLALGARPSDLARLRAPIGLPIAARTPREVAVAVVAEIIERRPAPAPRAGTGAQNRTLTPIRATVPALSKR